MFGELLESSSVSTSTTNKSWTVLASGVLQSACLVMLILVPLFYTRALPKVMLNTTFLPSSFAAPVPIASTNAAMKAKQPGTRLTFIRGVLHQPYRIPDQVSVFAESALPPDPVIGVQSAGNANNFDLLTNFRNSASSVSSPPPALVGRIKLGGIVQAAKIIDQPQPVYPRLAVIARVQGNVMMHAIIGRDGSVSELQVISGHPLLVQAALDAVKRWRYQPTLLNGEAVEVDTTITVSFVLGG